MSGPCTDCGGPDYQTLEARIAELEAENSSMADDVCSMTGAYERAEQAETALAERDRQYRAERRLRQAADSALVQALRHPNSKLDHVSEYLFRLERALAKEGSGDE